MGDWIMKTAKELMLGYIEGTAQQSGALFAEGGTLELPYLASIGMPPVLKGPAEIAKFLGFLHDTLYPGFAFKDVKIHIDTPDQVFAEYQGREAAVLWTSRSQGRQNLAAARGH
jgi:hypothetical protein